MKRAIDTHKIDQSLRRVGQLYLLVKSLNRIDVRGGTTDRAPVKQDDEFPSSPAGVRATEDLKENHPVV